MRLKNTNRSRKGSALLIVLGMLSFMVVSAVGFSIYMRQGRLPSSYLRRNISSRYLLKAALANAIEDLEGGFMSKYDIGEDDTDNPEVGRFYGIHDDPYPGVGDDMDKSSRQTGRRKFALGGSTKGSYQVNYMENGDYWFHRVFCPFGTLPHPNSNQESLEAPPLTVPTLTLEALAYLPPAIIDDVRKVSRLTRTAQWHQLPYEAGRYAYTAVNVSDLFDVNRLKADVARNSGTDRIALGSLCTQSPEEPTTVVQANVDQLEDVLAELENKKVNGNVTPFTSLADFNLVAAGMGAYGYAPFMDYIGKSSANMLADADPRQANALFVTDTYFPVTNAVYDLAAEQPFDTDFNERPGFLRAGMCLRKSKTGSQAYSIGDIFQANLGVGVVALWDYLDSDDVPMSLALPTVEAVPMVVGLNAPVGLKPKFDNIPNASKEGSFKTEGYYMEAGEGGAMQKVPTEVTIKRTCTQRGISSFGNRVTVPCLATYPFKRMVATNRKKAYKYRGIMKVWLGSVELKTNRTDSNRLYSYKNDTQGMGNTGWAIANGVATFLSEEFLSGKTLSAFSSDIKDTDSALDTFILRFNVSDAVMPALWKINEEIVQNMPGKHLMAEEGVAYKKEYQTLAGMNDDTVCPTAMRPQNEYVADYEKTWTAQAGSTFDPNAKYAAAGQNNQEITGTVGPYRLHAAVWVQVLNSAGKVVDMVPACQQDDIEWLGATKDDVGANPGSLICGGGTPFLSFSGKADWSYNNPDSFDGAADVVFSKLSAYAVDPRFNYAPEDWFCDDAQVSKDEWKQILGLGSSATYLGMNGRDHDIFMFVSDQEYLQSVGELQFLLALRDLDGNAANVMSSGMQNLETNSKPLSERTRNDIASNKFAHYDFFWRTYTAFPQSETEDEYGLNPFKLKLKGAGLNGADANVVSDVSGFKLNPFSEDARVINAAVVGTPFDYYVASTNNSQKQTGGNRNTLVDSIDYAKMMSTYSFGQSSLAQMSDNELADIAEEIQNAFAGMRTFDMNKAWGSLGWQICSDTSQINDNNKRFLSNNILLSQPLHSVDRKYLYSFWRECFDNRQQLFLMFVRAEPTSIGGGASGAITSAQLGGRAVALVWRDPSVPTGNGTRKARTEINNREDFRDFKKDNAPHKTRVLFYHQFD